MRLARLVAAAALLTTLLTTGLPLGAGPAQAAEPGCGVYAFAGAFESRASARRQARNLGAEIFDLDASDSPNAGLGLWAVAIGPMPRWQAREQAAEWRGQGVRGAYAGRRCFDDPR